MEEKDRLDQITRKIIGARLAHKRVGLLINFHSRLLKRGLKRIVNEFPDSAISAFSAVNGL